MLYAFWDSLILLTVELSTNRNSRILMLDIIFFPGQMINQPSENLISKRSVGDITDIVCVFYLRTTEENQFPLRTRCIFHRVLLFY